MLRFAILVSILSSGGTLSLVAQSTPANASMMHFDVKAMDKTVDPCQDFYQYACGNWIKSNPIPADQARWGRFNELDERNKQELRSILEAAAKPEPGRDPVTRQIGDYYAACMDEKGIEERGLSGLTGEFDRIRQLSDKAQLAAEIAHLHRIGVSSLFDFSSGQDFKDSTKVVAQLDQGGLGLPDRDYYLKDDPKSMELRQKYLAHVQRMFELAGRSPDAAKAMAATVMRMETELAKGSLDNVSRRDPDKIYHPMKRGDMPGLAPDFSWEQYFIATKAPRFQEIVVSYPEFFKAMDHLIQTAPLDDWKIYLGWHLLHSEAPLLPSAFLKENFDFYGRTLTGAKEMRPRWKRCVDYTDAQLGEALGKKYVEKTFGAAGKERMLKMVHALEQALGEDIQKLSWMTPATKKEALVKLKAITNKIGYPEKWRDYSSIVIKRDDAIGNGMRADEFEFQRVLDKIGKPVDPLGVGHDAAHRQRLLRSADEQHQFPGRHSAAAVLRQHDGRRRELRRHRHGHRPRVDARLRRPGPAVRPQGQSAGLVDARRRQGIPAARRLRRRSVRQLHGGAGRAHQRQADAGREHRG